jgi:hypothetical protein
MLAIWLQRRGQARQAGAAAGTQPGAPNAQPAEQRFPVPVVAGHGLLAVVTLVLAVLSAAGVGGS